MNIKFVLEFLVVLAAIYVGARTGGVGLGLWGAVGVLILATVFGLPPTSPPIDVILIILAVIMAASALEAAGGIDYLVQIAERIIRRYPKQITIVAPLVSYAFTFGAGTGHIYYPLLPVIYEVAHENGIRPERPIAISTIASQQAITASPVSAAMAAMIALFSPSNISLIQIMSIALPATLTGVIVGALVQMRVGKDLKIDEEYLRRLAAGEIEPPRSHTDQAVTIQPKAKLSAILFFIGVLLVIIAGAFPQLRPIVPSGDKTAPLSMPLTIQIIMLSVGAFILFLSKAPINDVPKTKTAQAGLTAVVGIFGLAWLGDTFIAANQKIVIDGLGDIATRFPVTFAIGLFFASVLLFSQAATTRALMPLGISLGLAPGSLIGMWPAVNGYFFLPTYGSLIAAINFDRSGTTRIGKYILNHSFMLPGLVATSVAVAVGLLLGSIIL